jgi:hypothetical protein
MNRWRKRESLKAKETHKNNDMVARKQMELQVLLVPKKDHQRNVNMVAVTSTSGLRVLVTAAHLMPGVYYITWLHETVHILRKVTAF